MRVNKSESLLHHPEINLHSTYNALSVVEISPRGSDNPGSSPGVVHFLSSEVFQTFSFAFDVHVNCHGMFCLGCAFFVFPSGGGETSSPPPPSPVASSATVARTSEGDGLHADPLLHSLCEYNFDVSVFFGGRGTALNPSSSHFRWVFRRRRDRQHRYVLLSSRFPTVS